MRRADSASGQGGDVSNGSTNRARSLRVAAVAMWAMGILAQSLTVVNNDGENTSLMTVPGSDLATVPHYGSALATVPQYGTELALYNADVVTVQKTWFSSLVIAMITSLAAVAGAALYMGGRSVRAIAQTRAEHPSQEGRPERVVDHRRRETIERPLNVAPADPSNNPLAIVPFRPQPQQRLVFGEWLLNFLNRERPHVNPEMNGEETRALGERDIKIVRVKDSLLTRTVGSLLSRIYGDGDTILLNGRRYVIVLESRQATETVGNTGAIALTPGRARVHIPAENTPEQLNERVPLFDISLPRPPLALEGPQNPAENRGGRETPWVPFEALTIEPLPSVGPNHGVVNRPQPQRNPQANRQEVNAPRGDFWGNIARRMNGWMNIAQNTANTVNPIRAERAANVVRSDTPTNRFGENTPHGF